MNGHDAPAVVRLSGNDLRDLAMQLGSASLNRQEVRVLVDADGLKLSFNGRAFGVGMGSVQP